MTMPIPQYSQRYDRGIRQWNLLIGGDFNTYLDVGKGKKGGKIEKSSKYSDNINLLCEEYSLIDLWRVRHPDDLNKFYLANKINKTQL